MRAAPPRFGVLACGFASRHAHAPPPSAPLLATPTLHISSAADATVPPAQQEALAGCFETPAWLRHDHGHAMPQRAEDLRAVTEFMEGHCSSGGKR